MDTIHRNARNMMVTFTRQQTVIPLPLLQHKRTHAFFHYLQDNVIKWQPGAQDIASLTSSSRSTSRLNLQQQSTYRANHYNNHPARSIMGPRPVARPRSVGLKAACARPGGVGLHRLPFAHPGSSSKQALAYMATWETRPDFGRVFFNAVSILRTYNKVH